MMLINLSYLMYELAHLAFGLSVSLAVAFLGYYLISITCPNMSSASRYRAGYYILFFCLSAVLVSHVLEDFIFDWF